MKTKEELNWAQKMEIAVGVTCHQMAIGPMAEYFDISVKVAEEVIAEYREEDVNTIIKAKVKKKVSEGLDKVKIKEEINVETISDLQKLHSIGEDRKNEGKGLQIIGGFNIIEAVQASDKLERARARRSDSEAGGGTLQEVTDITVQVIEHKGDIE